MKRSINLLLFLVISFKSLSQTPCQDTLLSNQACIIVDSILYMKSPRLSLTEGDGFGESEHYRLLMGLQSVCTIPELIHLTNSTDKYVKCYAFLSLCEKNIPVNYFKIILQNLSDEREILVTAGDRGEHKEIWLFIKDEAWTKLTDEQKSVIDKKIIANGSRVLDDLETFKRNNSSIMSNAKSLPVNNKYDSLLLELYLKKEVSTKEALIHLSTRYYDVVSIKILNNAFWLEDLFREQGMSWEPDKELYMLQIEIILDKDSVRGLELLKRRLKNETLLVFPELATKALEYKINPFPLAIERAKEEYSPFLLKPLIQFIVENKKANYYKQLAKQLENKKNEIAYSEEETKVIDSLIGLLK
jgi:hypothetical protein